MATQEHDLLKNLIHYLSRLPGLGPRSGRRIAFYLLKNQHHVLQPLIQILTNINHTISCCHQCGMVDVQSPCVICKDLTRDPSLLCVVGDMTDVWALERTRSFKGYYHVLGGVLSAFDQKTPNELSVASLVKRCQNPQIQEVVIALSPTVEGQTTSYYVADCLAHIENLRLSTLARGIPMGGELDYLDEGTLTMALSARHDLS